MATETLTARVRALFLASPGRWFSTRELADVGGFAAWRSRTAEARLQLEAEHLGTIENRLERHGRMRISTYRFVPAGQGTLFEQAG